MPLTRTCPAKAMVIGVPVGTAMACEVWQTSGKLFDLTRAVWETGIHGALTHGPLATGGGGNGQPAINTGGADMGTGTPMILTRGLGAAKFTLPPCAHKTTADIVNRKPGISGPHITSK